MIKMSGFTFIHNAIEGGYPIVEAIHAVAGVVDQMVVVDMYSTDGTIELLRLMRDEGIIDVVAEGYWEPGRGGECLKKNHSLCRDCCTEPIVLHFEADEVFDPDVIRVVQGMQELGFRYGDNIVVDRLQVEQNFQRCRWWTTPVHRIFRRDATICKDGETTDYHKTGGDVYRINCGYLWDVTNCFRDNWLGRVKNHAELWGLHDRNYGFGHCVGHHAKQGFTRVLDYDSFMSQDLWQHAMSPFALPDSLKFLVGMVKYDPYKSLKRLFGVSCG